MRNRKGFTLIELMVVILIVAILAAVLAPMLSGRINESKWTEGKTGAGTVATAIRAYCAEHEAAPADLAATGLTSADLDGKYFSRTSYVLSGVSWTTAGGPVYTITVTRDALKTGGPTGTYILREDGIFSGP